MGRAVRRERAKREKKGLTRGLALSFCLFAGAFLFLRSPYFWVRQFQIEGNSRVSDDDILARTGQTAPSIFAFDVDKASLLIESSPWVERALVTRRLPGTIVITVTERLPVAFMPVRDKMWLVDGSGRVLGEDDGSTVGLIALTGPMTQVAAGQTLDSATVGWALRVLSALGPVSRQKTTEISVQGEEVQLILDDGCVVLMGSNRPDPEVKTVSLESILEGLDRDGRIAGRIDLRFDRPAVKF